jgi:hypothetical protein
LHLVKGNELNDISCSLGTIAIVEAIITIKSIHIREVSITNTNDDDGEGKLTIIYQQVHCLVHIVDGSISQYQQHLVAIAPFLMRLVGKVDELLDDRGEVSRP